MAAVPSYRDIVSMLTSPVHCRGLVPGVTDTVGEAAPGCHGSGRARGSNRRDSVERWLR